MKETLYSINEEYLNILAQIEENEGELTPELEKALAINEEQHEAKLEAYGHIIANYRAEAEACKAEAERLKKKADNALKAALKTGTAIPGVELVTNTSLTIK